MGEETIVRSPRKGSLGHLSAVKQLIIVALDLKRRRVDLEAFQCIQLNILTSFGKSKITSLGPWF